MRQHRRIRVLWLIKGLGLGGAEKLLVSAARHVNRDEFRYEVGYFLPWKDTLCENLRDLGVSVTCFDLKHNWSLGGLYRLYRYLIAHQIDVLHLHLPVPGVFGRVAGRAAGVPGIVYTEHNVWPRLRPLSRLLNRLTFRWNDRAIAVSDEVRNSMQVRTPLPITIENGVDCTAIAGLENSRGDARRELGLGADDFVVGNVANLAPKKNHELLLDAFARLAQRVPNARLLVVGQYCGRDELLRQRAGALGITDRLILAGLRPDAIRLMQACDVFALSSSFEGLPVALLEAMALRKPAVCTSVGGIPSVLRQGQDGFLVPPDDAAAFAERLLEIATNPDLRDRMGGSAQTQVRARFDVAQMVRRVEQVYCEILRSKGVEL
jgi:glycosyltransferase involved in cell wall biosynthesis